MSSDLLLAVDVSNLIVRHHANKYSSDFDLAGRTLAGVCGAIRQIISLVEQERPTHLLLARDGKRADSFRRAISDTYKAHRADADEDLTRQFALAFAAFDALGWPCLAHPAHEADDVIASAAKSFPGRTVVVTGDKDLLATCSPDTTVLLLRSGGEHIRAGREQCLNLMGVTPDQVRDFKSLAGDSSDGIPGVNGVGAKTAVKVITQYGSLKALYAHLDAGGELDGVRPHIARKVADGRDAARLSWRLAGLVEHLPVAFEDLRTPAGGLSRPDDHTDAVRELGLGPLLRDTAKTVKVDHSNTDQAMTRLFETF